MLRVGQVGLKQSQIQNMERSTYLSHTLVDRMCECKNCRHTSIIPLPRHWLWLEGKINFALSCEGNWTLNVHMYTETLYQTKGSNPKNYLGRTVSLPMCRRVCMCVCVCACMRIYISMSPHNTLANTKVRCQPPSHWYACVHAHICNICTCVYVYIWQYMQTIKCVVYLFAYKNPISNCNKRHEKYVCM